MSSAEVDRPAAQHAPAARWRFLVRPPWVGWPGATGGSGAGMLALGYWQLRRAEDGNALSWAYTFEWPIFAVFAVVFWAKTIRDEFSPPDTGTDAAEAERALGGRPAGSAGRDDDQEAEQAEPEDKDLAAY